MKKNGMRPVPPDEILDEEFLEPVGLTANALAKAIPPNRITAIYSDGLPTTVHIELHIQSPICRFVGTV